MQPQASTGAGAGVVGGEGEFGGAELAEQVRHQVRLGVDRRDRVEGVGEAVGGGGARA